MNYEEFLSALRKTPRDWYLTQNCGWLRRGRIVLQCPISCLQGYSAMWWASCADDLGLPDALANEIMQAADNKYTDPQIRKDLLSACGLVDGELNAS